MDLGPSDKVRPILKEVKSFIDNEILPLEREYFDEVDKGDRWQYTERQTEILETLKEKARSKNLWNFFLTHWEGVRKKFQRFFAVSYTHLTLPTITGV